jgi:hypothetical protein
MLAKQAVLNFELPESSKSSEPAEFAHLPSKELTTFSFPNPPTSTLLEDVPGPPPPPILLVANL